MGGLPKDHHHHHHHHPHHPPPSTHSLTRKLTTRSVYALLPLALLHLYFFPRPLPPPLPTPTSHTAAAVPYSSSRTVTTTSGSPSLRLNVEKKRAAAPIQCDYSVGRWVPAAAAPLYNGTTCATIKDGQNCMAHGRPDTGYLHWRWQPRGCTLPPFDAAAFLRLLRGRHLAFVGDSMARNQLESLLCLLATASPPDLIYRDGGEDNKFRRWRFPSHNATVSLFWSPFLVRGVEKSAATGLDHNELYLDEVDERWASELSSTDVVILSVGHWFLHPAVYYEKGGEVVLGCHYCPKLNHTEVGFYGVYQKAFRTALDAAMGRGGGRYVVVATFSPSHFEGEWDKAGACPKTEPFKEGEKAVEGMDADMRRVQLEEVAAAAAAAAGGGAGGEGGRPGRDGDGADEARRAPGPLHVRVSLRKRGAGEGAERLRALVPAGAHRRLERGPPGDGAAVGGGGGPPELTTKAEGPVDPVGWTLRVVDGIWTVIRSGRTRISPSSRIRRDSHVEFWGRSSRESCKPWFLPLFSFFLITRSKCLFFKKRETEMRGPSEV